MGFIKAMQFALTEYICVSSEEQDDPPHDDDIYASAFGVFHTHVILADLHILSAYLNYILF